MNPLNKTLITLSLVAGLSSVAQATCSSNIDMGSHRITNVADPVNSMDVVNKRSLYDTLRKRFIRDSGKEVVLDITTNLIWQDDSAAETVEKKWVTQANYDAGNYSDTSGDTATTYCENMTLGGYNNWRMPTKEELAGIVKSSASDPAISGIFQHTASSFYWSSTTIVGYEDYAWLVGFSYGYDLWYFKSGSYYVRCVRDGQ